VLCTVVLTQYRRVTDGHADGQTDGIAVASTALAKRRAVKMWANAQRDGCPAEYRSMPQFG